MKKVKYLQRARISGEIIEEFLQPVKKSSRAIILCGGLPSTPSSKELMHFLSSKGYWVIFPRYRGTWESDGLLLKNSPHLDILDVVSSISSGFVDLWSGEKYKIKNPKIYIIGSSFGGAAAILASEDKRVRKIVALSPVIDWRVETEAEPIYWLRDFVKNAFGNAYRYKKESWNKLKSGKFYNPIAEIKKLDKNKIYIIHPQNDEVVTSATSIKFEKELNCKLTLLKDGGHLSLSAIRKAALWNKVSRFLD